MFRGVFFVLFVSLFISPSVLEFKHFRGQFRSADNIAILQIWGPLRQGRKEDSFERKTLNGLTPLR